MIETEQTVIVDAAIDDIWDYVRDMRRWAKLMPGMREFTVIDEDDSRWTLKVGVGGMVRTVKVLVHVDRWDGPERVAFSYKLEGDPVNGGGGYRAVSLAADRTEVTLTVRVEGSGSMAPMWEALGRPVLPGFAKSFAGQLKAEIELAVGVPGSPPSAATGKSSLLAAIGKWLRQLWRAIRG